MRPPIQYKKWQIFGHIAFFGEVEPIEGERAAVFLCHCGNLFTKKISKIKHCNSYSCGCSIKKQLNVFKTHGMTNSSEYNIWENMKTRCYNVKNIFYKDYGGRGIKVATEWLNSFENFYKDMGNRPSKNHTLERTENDKGYSKQNCKWATKKEQSNNRRNCIMVEHNNEKMTLKQWAEKLGLNYKRVHGNIKYRNWSIEKALHLS